MFENLINFFKKKDKKESTKTNKDTAKERLHLVLMQDRANVSADFLEMMKQEIIEVIKKYVNVDEDEINVTLTNQVNSDGTTGAPALYANIPIKNIKNEARQINLRKDESTKASSKNEKVELAKATDSKKSESAKKVEAKESENKKIAESKEKEESKKVDNKNAESKKEEAKASKKSENEQKEVGSKAEDAKVENDEKLEVKEENKSAENKVIDEKIEDEEIKEEKNA